MCIKQLIRQHLNKLFLIILLVTPFTIAIGQSTYQKVIASFGISSSRAAVITADNGIVTAREGIMKTDSLGNIQWAKSYQGSFFDIKLTPSSGYIAAGYIMRPGQPDFDFYVVKTDHQGDTVWTKSYGGSERDVAFSVSVLPDSGYAVCGYTESFGAGQADIFLVRLKSNGDTLWTRTIGNKFGDVGHKVIAKPDGSIILTGRTSIDSSGDDTDAVLIKFNPAGDTVWTRTYGGSEDELGEDVILTKDGGYAVVGSTNSFSAGGQVDVLFIKTNPLGIPVWSKTFGDVYVDESAAIKQSANGDYIIAGRMQSYNGGGGSCPPFGACYDAYLIKTNSQGDTLWTRKYGGDDLDWAYSIEEIENSGYLLTGFNQSVDLPLPGNVYLIKTDRDGLTPCSSFPTRTVLGSPEVEVSSGFMVSGGASVFSIKSEIEDVVYIEDSVLCSEMITSTLEHKIVPFKLIPNPITGQAILSFENSTNSAHQLIVFDTRGKIVVFQDGINDTQVVIEKGALNSGMYMFQLIKESQAIATGKLIVK